MSDATELIRILEGIDDNDEFSECDLSDEDLEVSFLVFTLFRICLYF